VSVNAPDTTKNGVPTSKTLTSKGKKLTVNLKLIKPATIKGKVVNSKGKGVEGVRVDAYGAGYGSATTNAKGEYKITGLAADTYAVTTQDPYYGGYFNGKSSKKKVATGKTVTFSTIKVKS
jgi:protocatechuate 3,4-dioxygenase beta subunit